MKIKNFIILVVLCLLTTAGCTQWTITGQNSLWKIDNDKGTSHDSNLVGIYKKGSQDDLIRNKSDVIAISMKSLFLKYIRDVTDFDVIVYAEVYDTVDDAKILKRIAFHRLNQPSDSYLNFTGNMLYGPIHFGGHPITIKLYVLELDKNDNALFSEFIKMASSIAGTAQPQYGPAIEVASSLIQFVINANQDDLEFSQEITFYPITDKDYDDYDSKKSKDVSLVALLERGDFIIVKQEDAARQSTNRWWQSNRQQVLEKAKKEFIPDDVTYNAETGRLEKDNKVFDEKTYAVLTISKPKEAVKRTMLEKISNSVHNTLNEISINREQVAGDNIEAIRRMAANGEATIRLFNAKNDISGKEDSDKAKELKKLLKDESLATTTPADKIVNSGILRLLCDETDDCFTDVASALAATSVAGTK